MCWVLLSTWVFGGGVGASVARAQEAPAPAPADAPAPSPEDEARARRLFENGELLYDEGRYEEAILAFQEAWALSQRPALLYNMANAYERLGRLEEAVQALNRFRVHATPEQQPVLQARVRAIEERIAAQRPPVAPARPEPVAEDLEPYPMLEPEPAPVRRSPAPWVVASVGAVVAVGGGAVAGTTWAVSRQQRDPDQWAATRPVNNAAFGSAMAGLAVGVSGVVWGAARGP